MTKLVLDGKIQVATTIVNYGNTTGDIFVVLARPDPRYRDKEGLCLNGPILPVGACQFIGGVVEVPAEHSVRTVANSLFKCSLSTPDIRIVSAALQELLEESGLDAEKFNRRGHDFRLLETVSRDGLDIHYLNLDLGVLSDQQVGNLHADMAPADDLFQIVHLNVSALRLADDGHVVALLDRGIIRTKQEFNGFLEIDKRNREFGEALSVARCANDDVRVRRIEDEWDVSNKIHRDIKGLKGIDLATINPAGPVRMFDPGIPGVRTDGNILHDFLRAHYNIQLQSLTRASPGQRPAIALGKNAL
jgi:hypothetical protein